MDRERWWRKDVMWLLWERSCGEREVDSKLTVWVVLRRIWNKIRGICDSWEISLVVLEVSNQDLCLFEWREVCWFLKEELRLRPTIEDGQIEELKASRLECVVACGTLSFSCVCDSKPVLEASCISFLHRNLFHVWQRSGINDPQGCLWQRSGIDHPQGCFLSFLLVRRDCWSPWVWKFRSQSFGRQLVFWRPVLPVRSPWFLITLPLPFTHIEPQQDRSTGKRLKIRRNWRNWRLEDQKTRLKTRRFDGSDKI